MQTKELAERFNLVAQDYDAQRRFFIPCFDDFYDTSVRFIAENYGLAQSILDLGAGTGLLTKYLFAYFPAAQFTLVDVSDQMLEMARKRFAACPGFMFLIADYSTALPQGSFDMITSALSIHHLTEEEKLTLYKNVYSQLPSGGVFANFDIFNGTTDVLTQQYNRWWYSFIAACGLVEKEGDSWRERRAFDKENSLEDTLALLRLAGFSTVDCLYRNMKFGVVLAVK